MGKKEPVLTTRQRKTLKRWLTLFGKDEIKPKDFTYFEMKRGWKIKTVWKDQQGVLSDFELQMPYAPLAKLENGKTYSVEDLLFGGEDEEDA